MNKKSDKNKQINTAINSYKKALKIINKLAGKKAISTKPLTEAQRVKLEGRY